jgi:nucleotide-binding universal stress UspA family protein
MTVLSQCPSLAVVYPEVAPRKELAVLPIQTILHPTDFSECSNGAFQIACSLARDHGARVVLVHVTSELFVAVPFVTIPPDPGYVREQLNKQLADLQPSEPDLRVDRYLREGDPATEILRLAHEIQSDLIVMGTHGRTGLGRLLVGSVAEQVLRKAFCPVLTVKTPLAKAPSAVVATS